MSAEKTLKEQLQAMKKKVRSARLGDRKDVLTHFKKAAARLSRRVREEAIRAKNSVKKAVGADA